MNICFISITNSGLKHAFTKLFSLANGATSENDMKMGLIHPSENVYNWKNADATVNFADHNIDRY